MNRAFKYAEPDGGEVGAQMKIGEVSKLSGVGIEALRFYEKSGLLERPGRTYSGYRAYRPEVLKRIAFIKQAQVLGFTLDEIRQLIAHKGNGESPCREVRGMVKSRLDELGERIAQMTRYREELSAELAKWDEAEEIEGHVCGLIEGSKIEYGIDVRAVKPSRKSR